MESRSPSWAKGCRRRGKNVPGLCFTDAETENPVVLSIYTVGVVTDPAPATGAALTHPEAGLHARESNEETAIMATTGSGKGWEDKFREAGSQLEEELRRAIRFLDEEVVPEVRKTGSAAFRTASDELRKLADRLDDERHKRESAGK